MSSVQPRRKILRRLRESFHHRKDIDALLNHMPPVTDSLKPRIDWLFDLIAWIRREGVIKSDLDFETGAPQAARVRYLLQLLDRNPNWKSSLAHFLRSVVRDTKGLELFIQAGLFSQDHFFAELISRLHEKLLPQVPEHDELYYIFGVNFRSPRDVEWIRLLDQVTFSRLIDLFYFDLGDSEKDWNSLKGDSEEALLLLSLQIQGFGLATDIRKRLSKYHFQQLPFYELPLLVERFITEPDPDIKKQLSHEVTNKLRQSQRVLAEVHKHLNDQGVSIQIVYKIERLESLLGRSKELLYLLENPEIDPVILSQFLENLVLENIERKSILALFNQNFSLLSRKIVDRSAETGEHYIARNKFEYLAMLNSALGGGVLTSFTTLVKYALYAFKLSSFYTGVFASLNYSVSFLAIQFCHFTLGTKQPSMTAPAIAQKMEGSTDELIDEIVHLMRSQFVAIVGNILGVVPVTLLIGFIFYKVSGSALLSEERAIHTLHDFSILGLTPFYACFTGILLWLSSICSGWVDNWFVLHRISPALAQSRRMIFIFGPVKARGIAMFFRKHILGISASISLGFLLGLSPAIFQFFGINMEVRHVTLSSGAIAAAMMSLPIHMVNSLDFYLAIAGIISMGILNVGVSFGLALFLAVKAKHTLAPQRRLIYQGLIRRFLERPRSFFWPEVPSVSEDLKI
jgi:site-specific recombinase